jgi:CBS domain-containing protein
MAEKLVRDLMLPLSAYASVSEDKTLRDALAALDKAQLGLTNDRHHHRAVLVLDRKGNVVGKLTHWAILRSLEPRLLGKDDMESLARAGLSPEFIQSMMDNMPVPADSLAGLCRSSASIRVKEAMVPARESIEADTPLNAAIRRFILTHSQSLLVTEGGKVVGILRLTDVFEEVADRIRACPS